MAREYSSNTFERSLREQNPSRQAGNEGALQLCPICSGMCMEASQASTGLMRYALMRSFSSSVSSESKQ